VRDHPYCEAHVDVDSSKRFGEPRKPDLFPYRGVQTQAECIDADNATTNTQLLSFFFANQTMLDNRNLIV
jgi:hypothetical protein